ncbi:MAG: type II toxin-antitoxin system RelE/ParE family toxin [Gammaproteobacteria bacterium]|nr:MAG: type II toxin-antitoxin system RelE/ParE family toxin [Gammaproteobacteria bacterium]
MVLFKLSTKAKIDLKKIGVFTEKRWGRSQRNTYLLQFDNCFHQISDNPYIGTTCDQVRPGYRLMPQGSHIIFYRVDDNNLVEISRILHKNMLPKL